MEAHCYLMEESETYAHILIEIEQSRYAINMNGTCENVKSYKSV